MMMSRVQAFRQLCRTMSASTDAATQASVATPPAPTPRDDELYRYLKVKCTSHEPAVLDSYEKFLRMAGQHLELNYVGTEEPWRVIKRRTMLASRFVHKKYRVQYEARSYFKHVIFKNMTSSTVDTFLEYIQRSLPEGVHMEVEKHRLAELPFDLTDQTSPNDSETQEEKPVPEPSK